MLFRHPYLWANSKEIPIRKLEMHTHTHREGGGREEGGRQRKRDTDQPFFLLGMQNPDIIASFPVTHVYTTK